MFQEAGFTFRPIRNWSTKHSEVKSIVKLHLLFRERAILLTFPVADRRVGV